MLSNQKSGAKTHIESKVPAFIPSIDKRSLPGAQNIVIVQCEFIIDQFKTEFFDLLDIDYPSSLNRAVTKRQSEYLAGRYAAQIALNLLSISETSIPTGQHRSPIWPQGIVGSITHTNIHAICAVAPKQKISILGIDLEKWLDNSLSEQIKSGIVSDQEEQWLKQQNMPFNKAFTLTFSAKESLFKALYPCVGRYFDFSVARMQEINTSDNTFKIALIETLTSSIKAGNVYEGVFSETEKEVMTMIQATQPTIVR